MESQGRISFPEYYRLIRSNANFRRLWIAQMISETGDWMYMIAIYDQLLKLTGGAAKSIGFAFVLQVLPQMLVSPMVGVLNDRLSRRKLMIVADFVRTAVVGLMLLAAALELVWLIYVLLFLETVFWALFEPGRSAVIPNITQGKDTLAANSLSSMTWSFNFAAGSAIGGLIAAAVGSEAVYVINSLSFLVSAYFISRMHFREPHLDHLPPMRFADLFDFSPIAEGVRYVAQDRRLLATIFVKCGLGFMAANWVLVTILGDRKFPTVLPGLDPKTAGIVGMSLLMGARGLGALIGPSVGTHIAGPNQTRMRAGIALGFFISSLGYIALGYAPTMPLACLSLIFAHAGGSMIWVFSSTMLQMNTEDKFRGRVFSSEFAFMTISMSISSSLAGAFIDRGVSPDTVATSAGCIMLFPAMLWLLAQRLWRKQGSTPNPV
ncbi:MAG: MFS transporter [Bryobacterales bacterium]|nr:MFS transporter [Bryobacterales bacterium]